VKACDGPGETSRNVGRSIELMARSYQLFKNAAGTQACGDTHGRRNDDDDACSRGKRKDRRQSAWGSKRRDRVPMKAAGASRGSDPRREGRGARSPLSGDLVPWTEDVIISSSDAGSSRLDPRLVSAGGLPLGGRERARDAARGHEDRGQILRERRPGDIPVYRRRSVTIAFNFDRRVRWPRVPESVLFRRPTS